MVAKGLSNTQLQFQVLFDSNVEVVRGQVQKNWLMYDKTQEEGNETNYHYLGESPPSEDKKATE